MVVKGFPQNGVNALPLKLLSTLFFPLFPTSVAKFICYIIFMSLFFFLLGLCHYPVHNQSSGHEDCSTQTLTSSGVSVHLHQCANLKTTGIHQN